MSTATAETHEIDEAAKGHDAHTKAADNTTPLPGKMTRPINVVFLGAGSTFCPKICRDVLTIEGADRGELRLVDIDADRLALTTQLVERVISDLGKQGGWSVKASTDRRSVLPGAHYAVCSVEVSGTDCVAWDNDIPLKYGVDQCIGDTIGPGGLFKGLRTVPVFIDILRDMRELCPGAVMLNYTNPMNMMVLAAGYAVPEVPVVGLCHSVQGTSHLLAEYADVPYDELDWECAGINHLAWFTKLQHKGKDLYESVLMEKFRRDLVAGRKEFADGNAVADEKNDWGDDNAKPYDQVDLIRKDMCVHFGAFITESSGHLSEYLPYYRKSEAGKALLRRAYHGGSRFYASNWPTWRKNMDDERRKWVSGEEKFDLNRSWEYGSWIIESMEKNAPLRIHGNVMNHATAVGKTSRGEAGKLITNLPGDGCVEVACYVDKNGIQPTRYGALPPQMAHICASNMAMFDLAAQAIITRSKQAAAHALMLDPLCAAVLTPSEIHAMTMEMFDAEKAFLPDYE